MRERPCLLMQVKQTVLVLHHVIIVIRIIIFVIILITSHDHCQGKESYLERVSKAFMAMTEKEQVRKMMMMTMIAIMIIVGDTEDVKHSICF